MKKLFITLIAILTAALLLLAGCGMAAVVNPNSPYFCKAVVGYDGQFQDGVYLLDSAGTLYFYNAATEEIAEYATNIRDFSVNTNTLILLSTNGEVSLEHLHTETSNPVYLCPDAVALADTVILQKDGSVIHYDFDTDQWESLDRVAKMVKADFRGAAIVDENNTLWLFDRSTKECKMIADGVTACDFSGWNKMHLANELWYVTEEQTLFLYSYDLVEGEFTRQVASSVQSVVAQSAGCYLAQQQDGTYIIGKCYDESFQYPIPIKGISADFEGNCYAILDENHELHLGKIDLQEDGYEAPDVAVMEDRTIAHP